jgi:hypothetical protein
MTPRIRHALLGWAAILLLVLSDATAYGAGWQTAIASWFGPNLYGNGMACGGTLTPSTWGVAHLVDRDTNPHADCGARYTLRYKGRTVSVTVIDAGPYISGRLFDLTRPVKDALGCPDLCRLEYKLGGSDGPPAPVRQAQHPPGPAALPQTDVAP